MTAVPEIARTLAAIHEWQEDTARPEVALTIDKESRQPAGARTWLRAPYCRCAPDELSGRSMTFMPAKWCYLVRICSYSIKRVAAVGAPAIRTSPCAKIARDQPECRRGDTMRMCNRSAATLAVMIATTPLTTFAAVTYKTSPDTSSA